MSSQKKAVICKIASLHFVIVEGGLPSKWPFRGILSYQRMCALVRRRQTEKACEELEVDGLEVAPSRTPPTSSRKIDDSGTYLGPGTVPMQDLAHCDCGILKPSLRP